MGLTDTKAKFPSEGDFRIYQLEKRVKELNKIISKIENKAYDWDGIKNAYYGDTIMKIIHPEFNLIVRGNEK